MNDNRPILIDITKKHQVWSIIKQIFSFKQTVKIWQNLQGRRQNASGIILDLSEKKEEFIVQNISRNAFKYDPQEKLYFHSEYRTTLFKAHISNQRRDKLKIDFPEALKNEEARLFPRVKFGFRSYQYVEVVLKISEDVKINVKCQLMDYSYGGLGFIIDQRYAKYLTDKSHIAIEDCTIRDLQKRFAIVRSTSLFENVYNGNKYVRIGAEFTS